MTDVLNGFNAMATSQIDAKFLSVIQENIDFKKYNMSEKSVYQILTNQNFLNSLYFTGISMLIMSIALVMSSIIRTKLSLSPIYLLKIFNYILKVIIYIYTYLKNYFFNIKPTYTILRSVSLITNKLKFNRELYMAVDWYIDSEVCKKKERKIEDIVNSVKEIYADDHINQFKREYDIMSCEQIGGDGEFIFKDSIVKYYTSKSQIEYNNDGETSKRDNFTYHLSSISDNRDSRILEEFCSYVLKEHELHKEPWHQMIYTNNGNKWSHGENLISPDNLKSIVLKKNLKERLTNTLNFFLKNPNFYKKNGKRRKIVIMPLGFPGTGKTTFVTTFANENKLHIYSLDPNNSYSGDLEHLVKSMDTSKGILLIDDLDHYINIDELSVYNNPNTINNHEVNTIDSSTVEEGIYKEYNQTIANVHRPPLIPIDNNFNVSKDNKKKITSKEFLDVLDGLGTKDGLIVFINVNDPSKISLLNNSSSSAFYREGRINMICVFELCDREMIIEQFENIFSHEPDMKLIDKIPENKYPPCLISQQFTSFVEKNGGYDCNNIDHNRELKKILVDLAEGNIMSNKNIIDKYTEELNSQKLISDKKENRSSIISQSENNKLISDSSLINTDIYEYKSIDNQQPIHKYTKELNSNNLIGDKKENILSINSQSENSKLINNSLLTNTDIKLDIYGYSIDKQPPIDTYKLNNFPVSYFANKNKLINDDENNDSDDDNESKQEDDNESEQEDDNESEQEDNNESEQEDDNESEQEDDNESEQEDDI